MFVVLHDIKYKNFTNNTIDERAVFAYKQIIGAGFIIHAGGDENLLIHFISNLILKCSQGTLCIPSVFTRAQVANEGLLWSL